MCLEKGKSKWFSQSVEKGFFCHCSLLAIRRHSQVPGRLWCVQGVMLSGQAHSCLKFLSHCAHTSHQ